MDDIPETIHESMKILDESMEILADLEITLQDEKEDRITPDMELHNLYDMTYDIHQSSKIKHAENNLVKRQSESHR